MMDEALCSGPNCKLGFRVFLTSGDNWYRIDRMHDDRIGSGTYSFCSRQCAIDWLAAERDIVRS